MPRPQFLVYLAFVVSNSHVCATPLPQTPDPPLSSTSAGYLALGLCLPFVLLAALKFTYLRHRRAQTIHTFSEDIAREITSSPSSFSENEKKSPPVGLGLDSPRVSAANVLRLPPNLVSKHTTESSLWHSPGFSSVSRILGRKDDPKLDLQGYMVGFLGSPAWETRIQVRRDIVVRKHVAGLASPASVVSPFSTLSRQPGTASHTGPYLSQASSVRTHRTGFSDSFGVSTRSRSRVANYGSDNSNSQPSNSHRSRRSQHRSTSSAAVSSRHVYVSTSSKGTGSRRHSRSSRSGLTNSKAHSRSLSLSFLEMNSPDLAEPAADFARITTMAIESVSGSASAIGTSIGTDTTEDGARGIIKSANPANPSTTGKTPNGTRGTFLRPGRFSLTAGINHSASSGITDCASIHPGSPPCPAATSVLPFDSVSGPALHSGSVSITRLSGSVPSGEEGAAKDKPAARGSFSPPPREYETLQVKMVDSHTPQILSQDSPYLSPQYFSPRVLPLSPSLSSPGAAAPPVLEFKYDVSDSTKGGRTSGGSTSSIRLNLTVSVTPSPSPSPTPSRKPSPSSSPLSSPSPSHLMSSFDGKATYLSPTRSSAAKERTKPLNITRSKAGTGESGDGDQRTGQRKLAVVGLGLSPRKSPARAKKARQEQDTFEPSLSGCTTHYRTRSTSPHMPGAMPITPTDSANVSSASSASTGKTSSKSPPRRRAIVSGPTTPNPDSFSFSDGSSGSATRSRKGTSSDDREEVESLVFAVDSSSGSGNTSASKAAKAERVTERKSWQSWDLNDLMTTDGRLDVDAVSAALGLSAVREDDAWSLEARSVHSIDRLADVDEQLESSIESLIRQPGSQLYPIIEEEDDFADASQVPPAPLPSPRLSVAPLGEQVRPTSYLVVAGQPQLQIPFLGTIGRESMLTVSTTDVRGSVNESILDLDLSRLNVDGFNLNDLQLNVSGFDVDASGFASANAQGIETSLFGLGTVERREGEESGAGVGVGVAF